MDTSQIRGELEAAKGYLEARGILDWIGREKLIDVCSGL